MNHVPLIYHSRIRSKQVRWYLEFEGRTLGTSVQRHGKSDNGCKLNQGPPPTTVPTRLSHTSNVVFQTSLHSLACLSQYKKGPEKSVHQQLRDESQAHPQRRGQVLRSADKKQPLARARVVVHLRALWIEGDRVMGTMYPGKSKGQRGGIVLEQRRWRISGNTRSQPTCYFGNSHLLEWWVRYLFLSDLYWDFF